MDRRVNSYDVARLAGVSQATVSYVMTRRKGKRIREETRRKVLAAAETLGYQPNRAAKSLATGKTGTVALWVPLTHCNVFNHIAGEIVGLAKASDIHVNIVQSAWETSDTLHRAGLISPTHVDAIIAHDATALVNDILKHEWLVPPIVSIGPAYSDLTDHVGVDLYGGSAQAVRHLFEVGCRTVAYVGNPNHFSLEDPRYRAYMELVTERKSQSILIPHDVAGDYEAGYSAVMTHVSPNNSPEGFFCWNDEVAIGVVRALSEMGLRVPDDIAVIGSDGIREGAYSQPTLSTMAQPFQEMCALAWSYMQRRWEEPDLPVQGTLVPMRLIQRASTTRS